MKSEQSPALSGRLRECIRAIGSGNQLAQKIGISRNTLENYLTGQSEPKLSTLQQIAELAGVRVAWLALGEGSQFDMAAPQPTAAAPAIDPELMGRVTDKILRTYKELAISIPPVDVGRLAAKWYDMVAREVEDPAERLGALAILAAQLKAELSAPITPDTASKRRA